jgi:hypothetical protein
MQGQSFGKAPSLLERIDRPLPIAGIPAGTPPVIAVGAQPWHPSNAVLVQMQREGGPAQYVRAVAEAFPFQEGAQWFRAVLPFLEEGRRLDYRVELMRAGQRLAALPADGSWLTVIGGPAAPAVQSATGPPPCPGRQRWGYDLHFLAALTLDLRAEVIGEVPEGYRINFFAEGGSLVGPRIDAKIRPEGGDWMCIRRDGVGVLDARLTFETSAGALISYRAGGVFDLGPDGYAKAAAGELTGSPPVYAHVAWSTAHPDWAWLNRWQGFGIGRVALEQLQVQADIYIPHVGERLRNA